MKKNSDKPDVWKHMKTYLKADLILGIGLGLIGSFAIGYLFYDSWIGALCFSPATIFFLRLYMEWKQKKKRRQLLLEFKELLYALSANLKAGYSFENAWIGAGKDLRILYPQGSQIAEEVEQVSTQLGLNVPIEKAISIFAEHCEAEEVQSFSQVVNTAKRSGGNLIHMMDKTINVIAEKIEVDQEIQTILSGKKMEQRIMCGMPILMMLYLRLTNSVYLDAMYHNWIGVLIMTVCIVGIGFAAWWGNRIVEIEV